LVLAEKDWVFVSDAHFTGERSEGMDAFLRFLDSQKDEIGHLVILGDLFEFLFGFKDGLPSQNGSDLEKSFPFPDYLPVFRGLQRLADQGIHIQYFEGNHDFFLSSFFEDWFRMKVEVYPDGREESLGGRRAFVAHGDLSNPKQWKYRLFRRIVKNRAMYDLIQRVGPQWSRRVALEMSHKSHEIYRARDPRSLVEAFHAFAHRKFLEGFGVVVLGHSHVPERIEEIIEGRKCLYLNVGDWVTHRSYLKFIPPDQFELRQYSK
jgi:UDP-2,3-diacylglucosamine hydrolase